MDELAFRIEIGANPPPYRCPLTPQLAASLMDAHVTIWECMSITSAALNEKSNIFPSYWLAGNWH